MPRRNYTAFLFLGLPLERRFGRGSDLVEARSYLGLDKFTYAEKRTLAVQAKEEYRRLPASELRHLLEMPQAGMLPVPRDLNAIIPAQFSSIPLATENLRRLD